MQTKNLNEYPLAALLARDAAVSGRSDKAAQLFPALTPGTPVPGVLMPEEACSWEGFVTLEGRPYRVAATREREETLYLFQSVEQQALGEGQLDSTLFQARSLMGEFRRELAPYMRGEKERFSVQDQADFARSYYRLLRLMDNLDLLRDAAAGQLRLIREQLDLERLCSMAALECTGLLEQQGIRVEFTGLCVPVVATGDGELLRQALLELISNCARRLKGGGVISISLRKKGSWARICVTDSGPAATAREKLALTARGAMPLIPMPGMGAGLGLSVAEHIAQLHEGAVLASAGEGAPKVYLALPVRTRLGESVSLNAPRPERNAGMNPYMIALSDVLGGEMLREDWLE